MPKHRELSMKLAVNELMWDRLAVTASEYERLSEFCYAGGVSRLLANISIQQYKGLLAHIENLRHTSTHLILQVLIQKTVRQS